MRNAACRLGLTVCLAAASAPGSAQAGASIVEPVVARAGPRDYEVGTWAALSAPTGRAGELADRGFKLGLTVTDVSSDWVGVGLDLSYSEWPCTGAGAALDQFFSAFGGAVHGTEVWMTGIQAGIHFKVVPLPGAPIAPWVWADAGVSRTNQHIEVPVDQLQAAGWQVSNASPEKVSYAPVFAGGVGVELGASSTMRIGLDARYEWLYLEGASDPFTTISVGAHVLFGRR